MKLITIDLDVDFVLGLSSKELLRLKEIIDASLPKKVDNNKLDFNALKEYYNLVFTKSMRVVSDKTKTNFNKRIKEGYTKLDIQKVIDNASNDKFHEPNEFKHVTLEFLSRSDVFNRYVSEKNHQVPRNKKLQQQQGHTNH
jgi:uncharacterized phage protein (TIGR02220 family)